MKFSIRDLLLLTVIVAMALGWWVDHLRLNEQVKKAKDDASFYFNELTKFKPPPTAPL